MSRITVIHPDKQELLQPHCVLPIVPLESLDWNYRNSEVASSAEFSGDCKRYELRLRYALLLSDDPEVSLQRESGPVEVEVVLSYIQNYAPNTDPVTTSILLNIPQLGVKDLPISQSPVPYLRAEMFDELMEMCPSLVLLTLGDESAFPWEHLKGSWHGDGCDGTRCSHLYG